MRAPIPTTTWTARLTTRPSIVAALEALTATAMMLLLAAVLWPIAVEQTEGAPAPGKTAASTSRAIAPDRADDETVASIYAGAPLYLRSDVRLQRPDGTDMTLKRLGWDSDPLYFPIDGGARVIRWSGSFGVMVDFVHNKAISRVGKGAHGRKISNGIIEDVETDGRLKGRPAPSPLRLTDLVDRLEFTHGHNMLLLTGVARLAPLTPRIRPYLGFGLGVTVPHVEVWFTGEAPDQRTNEYQLSGSAWQVLAGLELRTGRGSYYVEYKLLWSAIDVALTGGQSWSLKRLQSPWLPRWLIEPFVGLTEMPGDLWRQLRRWWKGEAPPLGRLSTRLWAHGFYGGAGYVWPHAP